MKKEKNFWDRLVKGLYIGLMIFICLIFMLILFSIKGYCASEQDYFPIHQNYNGLIGESYITVIESALDSENNYIFIHFIDSTPSQIRVNYLVQSKAVGEPQIYGEKYSNLTNFSLYRIGNGLYSVGILTIRSNGTYTNTALNNGFASFTNMPSSNYSNLVDYVSNFQVYTNNTESRQIVLLYQDGETIPDGNTANDDMEKPDIDDYVPSWNNIPSFDGSSVENALSSIWDITVWTAENTRDTIKGVGQYIGDTLRWTSQKIIDNIRGKIDELKTGIINAINSVSTFVQDIKGLVTGMCNAIDYIKEPLDTTTIQATITGSTAFDDVSTITGAFNDFKAVFDNTSEPNEYKIPLHLENVSILGQTQAQYIDLSIIANERSLIRAFCWVVTTFSLFVTVIDALPNYLKGGDE